MNIFGVQSNSAYTTSSATSLSDAASSGYDPVKEFMEYASETPAQRLFDTWLKSEGISKDDYNAMSAVEKQQVLDKFQEYIKAKLRGEMTDAANSATSRSSSAA
jgi:predicted amidohydrolase